MCPHLLVVVTKYHGLLTEKRPLSPWTITPTVSMLNRVVPAHGTKQNTCKHWNKAPFHNSPNPIPSEIFKVCTIKSVHKQFRKLKIMSTKYTQDLKYLSGYRGGCPCFTRNVHGSDLLPGHAGLAGGRQHGALPAPVTPRQRRRGEPCDQGRKVCPDEVQMLSRRERGPLHSSANQIPNLSLQKCPL